MTEIRRMQSEERDAAHACYRRNDYGGSIREADLPLVAVAGAEIVGVVRLAREEGHQILRGMFLDANQRGRGLGTRMIQALVAEMDLSPCWLICGPHLIRFYGQVGFALAHDEEAPPFLQERVLEYRQTYGPQCLLRRRA